VATRRQVALNTKKPIPTGKRSPPPPPPPVRDSRNEIPKIALTLTRGSGVMAGTHAAIAVATFGAGHQNLGMIAAYFAAMYGGVLLLNYGEVQKLVRRRCPSGSETAMCGGNADPTNYMDYTSDTCMFRFTLEQVNRMRCSVLNYRQVLIDDSVCGDSVVGVSEVCDDGNTLGGDGCSSTCLSDETCANKIVDVGEACDDGNTKNGDGCRADCAGKEVWGDGLVDTIKKEVCDDGNTDAGDGCAADCKSLEVCGDGIIDDARGEVCDDYNTEDDDGCARDCKSDETCGNDIVDVGEACDGSSDCDAKCQKKKKTPVEPKPQETKVVVTPEAPSSGCGGCQNGGTPWLAAFVALMLFTRRRSRHH
jgi:cysteine-rich repeat protein